MLTFELKKKNFISHFFLVVFVNMTDFVSYVISLLKK